MKARKAFKVCGRCDRAYVTVEYSLVCPQCKEIQSEETGYSLSTIRNYEKLIWYDPEKRKDFAWTLIGLENKESGMFEFEYIYDCWSQELKDFIEKGEMPTDGE
jgi:hypothetical protein